MRRCKRGQFIKRRSLQVAERKLREAAEVSLGPSSFESGAGNNNGEAEQTINEFDSLSSVTRGELSRMLLELNVPGLNSSEDPNMEDVILDWVTRDVNFNNPFQVEESIRQEIVRQA